jgi:NADPH-dependent 2,4-dienoyl-CoA reductase/sulfur reductase-like enzyme
MAQRVVVAGGGLGGLRAAEQLRVAGYHGDLVVVGAEPHLPYNRPPLSKEGLSGDLAHATLEFRRKAAVADVEWRLGRRVASADLTARTVSLDDGQVLSYDGLVAATGAHVRRLPLDAPLEWRHVVRTLDDAQALRAQLQPGRPVVVIGAGFIGCEVAATARLLGCTVTLVDPLPVPLLRPLGPEVGTELRRRHEAHGVEFRMGRTVARIAGTDAGDGPHHVVLDDGEVLPARWWSRRWGRSPRWPGSRATASTSPTGCSATVVCVR